MKPVATTSELIARAVQCHRFTYNCETQLQEALWEVLIAYFDHVDREVRLDETCRIDFMIGRVGIEVKTTGSAVSVARQLLRYAGSDAVDELVLVTHKRSSADLLRDTIGGKPLTVVWIGGVL